LRDEAHAIIAMGHEIPDDYKSLPMPENYYHCWSWFGELSRTRSSNGFGQNPISYSEIDAWSRLISIDLTPLEVSAIIRLDSAYLNIQAEQIAKRSKTK
jgi:hypothetical protein